MANAIPMQNIASMGRHGDTMLAHINAREARLLELFGGSGTINPKTGLLEFYDGGDGAGEGEPGDPGGVGGGDNGNGPGSGVGGDMGGYEGSFADQTEGIGGSFGYYEGLQPPDPGNIKGDTDIENIAEMPHAKNNMFENLMDQISGNINGIAHGFAKGLTSLGIKTGMKYGLSTSGLTLGTIGSLAFGIPMGMAMGYMFENASPPSAETVAANTNPGLSGIDTTGIEGTATGMPGSETSPTPAIPDRRAMLQGRVSYPRQRIALTGLPVR